MPFLEFAAASLATRLFAGFEAFPACFSGFLTFEVTTLAIFFGFIFELGFGFFAVTLEGLGAAFFVCFGIPEQLEKTIVPAARNAFAFRGAGTKAAQHH